MSDFSIDYILNRAGQQYVGTNGSIGIMERMKLYQNEQPYYDCHRQLLHPYLPLRPIVKEFQDGLGEAEFGQLPMFDWLQYTRYHPPKLPRSFRAGPSKRTPGRLPRIPFSPMQLQKLEEAYKNSHYLSAEDANNLAESLELTNTRVKIWFQNRRARERRERRSKEEGCESNLSSTASSPEPEDLVVIV